MLFGRSVFHSVVERLETEAREAGLDEDPRPLSARIAGLNASFAAATAETETARFFRSESAYLDALADLASHAEEPLPQEQPPQPALPPPHLTRLSAEEIAEDLAITPDMTTAGLQDLRRSFARQNHPDSVAGEWRAAATTRMTIANQMIDAALRTRRSR